LKALAKAVIQKILHCSLSATIKPNLQSLQNIIKTQNGKETNKQKVYHYNSVTTFRNHLRQLINDIHPSTKDRWCSDRKKIWILLSLEFLVSKVYIKDNDFVKGDTLFTIEQWLRIKDWWSRSHFGSNSNLKFSKADRKRIS
jgi:hypothetical protein